MKRLFWSMLLILPCGAFAAEVYRSIDENGQVVYSDRPTAAAEVVEINTSVPGSQTAVGTPADDDESDNSDSPLMAEVPREATPEEVAADRERNCAVAQEMMTAYSQSHRLFREDANGEREYLSAEEIDEARARAESNVASWCD